ncbi:protein NIM1-interacting 2 [Tanacetum coccineum]
MAIAMIPQPLAIFSPSGFSHFSNAVAKKKRIKDAKLQAGTSTYEAKKAKEMAMIEFKEMEFLTIDADSLPEPKASIIRSRQEKIIAKYTQQSKEAEQGSGRWRQRGDRKEKRERSEGRGRGTVVWLSNDDEVEEFFAILRRMRDAVKYLEKGGDGGVKLPVVAREGVEGEVCEKKKTDVVLLDLNSEPDDRE